MSTSHVVAAALGLLGCNASAQIQLSVQAANNAGITLERSDGTRAVQSIAAGTTITSPESVNIHEGSLGGILGMLGLGASMNLNHLVSPPHAGPLPALPRDESVRITTDVSAASSAAFNSLHTSGDPAGNPGAQLYDVTLTRAGPTRAHILLQVSASLLDPDTTASIRVTGGGVDESWSWTGPTPAWPFPPTSTLYDTRELTVQFVDSLTLRVEMSGTTAASGGGVFGDGFHIGLRMAASEVKGQNDSHGDRAARPSGAGDPDRASAHRTTSITTCDAYSPDTCTLCVASR